MKYLFAVFFLAAVTVCSCSKSNVTPTYKLLDTGAYTVTSGTLVIPTSDSTITYTAPSAQIIIYPHTQKLADGFDIVGIKWNKQTNSYTTVNITLPAAPAVNDKFAVSATGTRVVNMYQSYYKTGAQQTRWDYTYGNLNVSDYNNAQTGNLLNAAFSASAYNNSTNNLAVISGNISLKLTVK